MTKDQKQVLQIIAKGLNTHYTKTKQMASKYSPDNMTAKGTILTVEATILGIQSALLGSGVYGTVEEGRKFLEACGLDIDIIGETDE